MGPTYLILCFRFIGDVLMTTPLAASIKKAQPDAIIDYMVFEGTGGVLAKNPHIRKIITARRDRRNIDLLLSLFRKYDTAIAAYPSDRTAIAAAIAGKQSIGLSYNRRNSWWKKIILNSQYFCDDRCHVVQNILPLLGSLPIPLIPYVEMWYDGSDELFSSRIVPDSPFVVFHPFSRNKCKYWPVTSWGKLAQLVHKHTDCRVLFTRTPDSTDATYLSEILASAPDSVLVLNKPCALPQLAAIIKRSQGYVGIDTVMTHIAASLKVPTVAIFGPTLTRYWAPWVNGVKDSSPYRINKGVQHNDTVTVVQKDWDCVPCNKENCAVSTKNRMECLDAILPEDVFCELVKSL